MQTLRVRISIALEDAESGTMKLLVVSEDSSEAAYSEDLVDQILEDLGLGGRADENQQVPFKVATLDAALQKAVETCTALEFNDRFVPSTRTVDIPRPELLLRDLVELNHVAIAWSAGDIKDDEIGKTCRDRGLSFFTDVPESVREKYRSDYLIRHKGRDVFAGAHVRHGRSHDVVKTHLHFDYEAREIVVAFVMGHRELRESEVHEVRPGVEGTLMCSSAEWARIKLLSGQQKAEWKQGVSRIGQTFWSSKPKITVLEILNGGIVDGSDPALRLVQGRLNGTIDGRIASVKVRDRRQANSVELE